MNIKYIFGIAILLMDRTYSLNEDTKTDKSHQQRILLRKLQNFQETKPLTWNEILADVLVNKIGIFSFKSQDKEDVIKNDAPISKEKTVFTDFFSKVFVVYKKFIYDAFVGTRKENDDELIFEVSPIDPNRVKDENPKIDPEEITRPAEVTFAKGPKSEVELVEPKYHGKIKLEESTTKNPDNNAGPTLKHSVSSVQNSDDPVKDSVDLVNKINVNPSVEEKKVDCAEGFVKSETGNCVNNSSRLILAIPNQCPLGYRKDWLGNCRKIFHF